MLKILFFVNVILFQKKYLYIYKNKTTNNLVKAKKK